MRNSRGTSNLCRLRSHSPNLASSTRERSLTLTYVVFPIGGVEDSAEDKRDKGEEKEVDAVEVGFSLDEFLRCCISGGHPGRAPARWGPAR